MVTGAQQVFSQGLLNEWIKKESEATFLGCSQIEAVPLKQFNNFTFSVYGTQLDRHESIKKLYYLLVISLTLRFYQQRCLFRRCTCALAEHTCGLKCELT